MGGPPRRLAELAARIAAAFGVRHCTPTRRPRCCAPSPGSASSCPTPGPGCYAASIIRRCRCCSNTRSCTGSGPRTAGPGGTPWVRDGRFRPEYVPGGVVSGRWATRGGGALQIPKVVRRAVVADPGWQLVVADAGQLEPRVLAAVSGDARLATAGAAGDLYAALAAGRVRRRPGPAKLALLGAMYGQTGGAALPALAALQAQLSDRLRTTWRRRPVPARRAAWSAPGWAGPARRGRPVRRR